MELQILKKVQQKFYPQNLLMRIVLILLPGITIHIIIQVHSKGTLIFAKLINLF